MAPLPPALPRRSRPVALRQGLGRLLATMGWLSRLALAAAVFLVATALAGAHIASGVRLALLGLGAAVGLPWLVRLWLRQRLRRPGAPRPRLAGPWFIAAVNGGLLLLLAVGFSTDTGRALRRRGDWFLGRAEGWLPSRVRSLCSHTGRWLEGLEPPRSTVALLGHDAVVPAAASPSGAEHVTDQRARAAGGWFHPLAGPRRALPPNAGCRFGAPRPGQRPAECELGHCGVDLFRRSGTPVYAVHDGRVQTVQRDVARGGRSGRFVILSHRDDRVRTVYVHLERIASGLRPGDAVEGGVTVIGTVGDSGCRNTPPHLHFGLAAVQRGGPRMLDPEPLLWLWALPAPAHPAAPQLASSRLQPSP